MGTVDSSDRFRSLMRSMHASGEARKYTEINFVLVEETRKKII